MEGLDWRWLLLWMVLIVVFCILVPAIVSQLWDHAWLDTDDVQIWWLPVVDLIPKGIDPTTVDASESASAAEQWLNRQMLRYVKRGRIEVRVTAMVRPIRRGLSYASLPDSTWSKCQGLMTKLQKRPDLWLSIKE